MKRKQQAEELLCRDLKMPRKNELLKSVMNLG